MSKTNVEAYLNFNGRTEEALEFYTAKLGAEILMVMRFQDAPPGNECPPEEGSNMKPESIMHSAFRIGETTIMASDCSCTGNPKFEGFSLSLNLSSEAEAKGLFEALSEGGKVEMPLAKTFWSPLFGVVSDKFGVSWMVHVVGDFDCPQQAKS